MKKIISTFVFLNLLLIPSYAHANHMPGAMEYAALIGLAGLAAGLVIASIVLLVRVISKKEYSTRDNFIVWISVFLGTPIVLLAIFFIIILMAKLGF